MKFEKVMRLWITGLILFFVSVAAYAAEEDTLTVSPTDTPGIYEFTLSGTRDSDTVAVMTVERHSSDTIAYCGGDSLKKTTEKSVQAVSRSTESEEIPLFTESGIDIQVPAGSACIPRLSVDAVISNGKNPGSSAYQTKFRIFLQPGSLHIVSYRVRQPMDTDYRYGKVILPPDHSWEVEGIGTLLNSLILPPVNLSLQNVTAEITGTDSFTLRNLGAELSSGEKFNAWGKFRWNPDTLSFELKDAGLQ